MLVNVVVVVVCFYCIVLFLFDFGLCWVIGGLFFVVLFCVLLWMVVSYYFVLWSLDFFCFCVFEDGEVVIVWFVL